MSSLFNLIRETSSSFFDLKLSLPRKRVGLSELNRQLVHLLGVLSVPACYLLGPSIVAGGALAVALFMTLLTTVENAPRVVEDLLRDLGGEEGLRDRPYCSAVIFFAVVGGGFFLLPPSLASVVVIVLTVGDSFSTLIGLGWGKSKLPGVEGKTWAGSFGGFFASLLAISLFSLFVSVPLLPGFLAAFAGITAEALTGRGDDNLPIAVASLLAAGPFWLF